jgi:hypothetical protein
MGADDQNVEAGITGARSRSPAAVPATMRAVVLDAPGPPSALAIREIPVPVPSAGRVLIRVRAFGLNRLGLYARLGLSQEVTFPRVPGAAGTAAVPISAPISHRSRTRTRPPRTCGGVSSSSATRGCGAFWPARPVTSAGDSAAPGELQRPR